MNYSVAKANAGWALGFRNFFKPRDVFLHDGKSLRRFTIGAKVQMAAVFAAFVLLAWSAFATFQAIAAMNGDVARMQAQMVQMEADVAQMLDAQFAAAIPAVERHGGEVDRLIGDAIFATFHGERCSERAARAALELQAATTAVRDGRPDWPRFRVGLNAGAASLAVLGTGTGRTYSAIGDTVNLGSRIEALAPAGGVAISGEVAAALPGAETDPLGTVTVKGRAEPVEVLLLRAFA